jgi:hypothetical protein
MLAKMTNRLGKCDPLPDCPRIGRDGPLHAGPARSYGRLVGPLSVRNTRGVSFTRFNSPIAHRSLPLNLLSDPVRLGSD